MKNVVLIQMAKITDFMEELRKKLVEGKGVAESSAKAYMRVMMTLNEKQPFTTLAFLRKKDTIMEKVNAYAPSTQKTVLASIVSVLSTVSDKPTYKGIYKFYYDAMMGKTITVSVINQSPMALNVTEADRLTRDSMRRLSFEGAFT
jgi:hypothetical protein